MPNVQIKLILLAQSDILMWRSYSLLLVAHPTNHAPPQIRVIPVEIMIIIASELLCFLV